jgi:glyoxylase-like metal-dependent hydrolase (beta-lactamase superfamily II)
MSQPQPFAHADVPGHVCALVRRVFDGRVIFHDGVSEIAPGVSLHRIGGHTMGMQCVRVRTARGRVVLASDAAHFYENMEKRSPFPIVHSVSDLIDGYQTMSDLADSARHAIPGHDPLVMARYPAPEEGSARNHRAARRRPRAVSGSPDSRQEPLDVTARVGDEGGT